MTRGWKIAFLALLALGVLLLAYYLRAVFLPLLVALLLAYVLNPVLGALERRKVPRKASIAGVYVVLLGVMAVVAFVAVPGAFGQASDFVRDTFLGENPKINRLIAKAEPMLVRSVGPERAEEILKIAREKIAEVKHDLPQLSARIFGEVVSFLTGGIATLFSIVSFLILVPVYLFFLLKNLNPWWEQLTHWIPRTYRTQALATLGRIHRANMSFFRGQLTISLLEGLIIFIGLSLIHVGYPLLFGLLYTVASVIPFLGVITMFAGVELFVLADTGQFGTTFWLVAGLFGLIQVLEAGGLPAADPRQGDRPPPDGGHPGAAQRGTAPRPLRRAAGDPAGVDAEDPFRGLRPSDVRGSGRPDAGPAKTRGRRQPSA